MDSASIKILTAVGVASAAAAFAPAINKFRNVPAGSCALLGAVLPWLLYAIASRWSISGSVALLGLTLFVSSFLFALLFYSVEEASTTRTIAIGAMTVAICASIYLCAFVAYGVLLSGS